MDRIYVEKLINKIRYIITAFIFISAVSSFLNSVPSVYISIFFGGLVYLTVCIVNQIYIFRKKFSTVLVYVSVTIEVLNVFFVKAAFQGDVYNGWGLAVKEPATFIMFFVVIVVHALRFNKWLNLYAGVLSVACSIIIIILGIKLGGMTFVTDAKLIYTPKSLRLATELAKLLFLGGTAFFLYLMAKFTSGFIAEINSGKKISDENLQSTSSLLSDVRDIAINFSSSMEEISAMTVSLADNTNKQTSMEERIMEASMQNVENIEKLSSYTMEQSGSFLNLSERVADLSASINELVNETRNALKVTETIATRIADGEKALNSTNEIMVSIERSSNEMTNIMGLINDISDQINLLSLNAAIESARAGDSGRGFAVVADEISKLADRTAQSIKDIDQLIRNNSTEIEKGIQSLKYTNDLITHIIEDTDSIGQLIKRISEYMEEQQKYNNSVVSESEKMKSISDDIQKAIELHNESTKSISQAIKEIGQFAQQNSSASEEMAATTEEVNSMAQNLHRLIDGFKLNQ